MQKAIASGGDGECGAAGARARESPRRGTQRLNEMVGVIGDVKTDE